MIYTQRGQRGLPYDSVVYVIPQENTSPEQYGQNFIRAYRAAAQKRPGGLPLSATNRASVVVLGCLCRWGSGEFVMDTNFVDIIGIDPATCVLESPGTTVATTADDYRIVGLTLRTTGTQPTRPTPASPAAYFPQGPSGLHVLENVVLEQTQLLANLTRYGEGYSGRYQVEAKAPSGASVYCFEGTCTGTFTFEMTLNNAGVCFLLGGAEFTASPKYDRIDISCPNALTTSVVNLFGRSFQGGGEYLRVRLWVPSISGAAGTVNCAVARLTDTVASTVQSINTGERLDCQYVEFEADEVNAFGVVLNPASNAAASVFGFHVGTFRARFNTLRAFAVTMGSGNAAIGNAGTRYCYWDRLALEKMSATGANLQLFLFAVQRVPGGVLTEFSTRSTVNQLDFLGPNIQNIGEIMWFGTGVAGVTAVFNGIARNFRLPRAPFANTIRGKVTGQFGRGTTNASVGELYNWDTMTGVFGPCSMLFDNCLVRGLGARRPVDDARSNTLIARNCVFLAETPTECIATTSVNVNVRLEGCLLNKAAPLGLNVVNQTPTGTFTDNNLQ